MSSEVHVSSTADSTIRCEQETRERISVVGLGKLGTPLAACFAWRGFPTVAVDLDPLKVQAISNNSAWGYEPGLQELLHATDGRLTATHDYKKAISESDFTFVVVPTPSDETGTLSLRDMIRALTEVGVALRAKQGFHLVVIVSTVMPGAIRRDLVPVIEAQSGKKCGVEFGLCYSPEFIALGSVIRDLLQPDFILIGESDSRSGQMLADLYGRFCENASPVARMNFVNAELAKLAINSYLTTKISFANLLARLCERLPGGDVDAVTSAMGLDSRIGGKYLKGAIAFGGPCFPRDNLAFAALARSLGASVTLPEATEAFNQQQVFWLTQVVKTLLPRNGRAGILGLAYKPNSGVVEESAGLRLAQALLSEGLPVAVYDPAAMSEAQNALLPANQPPAQITFAASAAECVEQSDVVICTTPWEEFKELAVADFVGDGQTRTLIDCWRLLGHLRGHAQLSYVPLGINTEA
jgi:UDPglucose 6-dehydrogenase